MSCVFYASLDLNLDWRLFSLPDWVSFDRCHISLSLFALVLTLGICKKLLAYWVFVFYRTDVLVFQILVESVFDLGHCATEEQVHF